MDLVATSFCTLQYRIFVCVDVCMDYVIMCSRYCLTCIKLVFQKYMYTRSACYGNEIIPSHEKGAEMLN
jgi:hypothetical protein